MISATCDSNCFFYIYPCNFLESETQCWLIHTTIVCLYPRWRPPPSWFSRRAVLDHGGTCIAHIYQHTKFSAYRSRMSQDYHLCISKMAAVAILNFQKSAILDPRWHLYCPYLSACQIWCMSDCRSRISQHMPICAYFKMAAAAILNFQKVRSSTARILLKTTLP